MDGLTRQANLKPGRSKTPEWNTQLKKKYRYMESNEIVRKQILKVVDNQLRANDPPETKQTLERLKGLGYSDEDSRILIAQCVSIEVFNALKFKTPYDHKRYLANLNKLPDEPFDN